MKGYILMFLHLMVSLSNEQQSGLPHLPLSGEPNSTVVANSALGTRLAVTPPIYLTTVDGVMFYVNFIDLEKSDWQEARKYCKDHGYHLASVKTEKQRKELVEKLSIYPGDPNYFQYYWIAARESRGLRMMRWDETETQPDQKVVVQWKDKHLEDYPLQYCGVLGVWGNASAILLHQFFSTTCGSSQRILCMY